VELAEVLRRRQMVRRYDRRVPAPALVDAVVDAALRAPSAGFTQAVSYLVLSGAEVAEFWSTTTTPGDPDRWLVGMRTAPVLILVWTDQAAYLDRYAEPDKGWTDRDPGRWSAPYWWVDAGMGVMAALLRAVDLGLGACFFGVPADRVTAVRRRFGVPEEQRAVGVLSLGFADHSPRPAEEQPARRPRRPRRARSELVHRSRWSR
jgi:nitroreductase